jgi:hypothetical protein
MLLVFEFALWIVLICLVVLIVAHTRRASKCTCSDGHTRAALREADWYGNDREDQDCPSQLLHLKVAIAGRITCEADVRDAAELGRSLGWARSVWPKTLTSIEVSRNGKSIVFANQIGMEITNRYCRSGGISAKSVERVQMDTLGDVPEQPLIEMMVREWL